jgi:hypothetical protein
MKSFSPSTTKIQLTIILLAYLIFVSIFGYAFRYAMNPDGLSLLRLAGYIAEGNFEQSVTHSWSPLTSWLISPFLFFGFDGLTAARIAIALCGAGMLLCSWFLALRFDLSKKLRFIAVLIAALLISFWTIQNISADVLVAALTLWYIYLVTDPDALTKGRRTFFCGVVGGFSYLAHHYAFPFFLLHFPVMLFLSGYIDRDKEVFPWKKVLLSWGSGMAGFLIIASLWVGVVSVKYGHFTISSKGSIVNAGIGPKGVGHPFFTGGLYKPRDAYAIHVCEDPSEVKFNTWSPFESKEYFIYKLKLIKSNFVYIFNHFVNLSPFFTYAFMIGTLVLIPIALYFNPSNQKQKFLYAWVIVTFSIYSSGFIVLIAKSPRRFYALMTVFLLLAFHFIEKLGNAFGDGVSGRRKKLLALYLLVIVVPAFSLKPGVHFLKSLKNITTIEQVNPYKEIAEQIDTVEFSDPYAVIRSSQKLTTDYYITYFLGKQLLGRPLSTDVEGVTKELKAADARSLVVFDNQEIVGKLKNDDRYVHIASKKLINDNRYEQAVNIVFQYHEIITGWDKEVNVFAIK